MTDAKTVDLPLCAVMVGDIACTSTGPMAVTFVRDDPATGQTTIHLGAGIKFTNSRRNILVCVDPT